MATKEEIWAAADALEEAGGKATLANVREHLGGGSYTDISQHMQTWRARQQALAAPMREPAPAAVTERLGELAADLCGVALDLANARLAAEREALDLADQLAGDLDRARGEAERLGREVASLTEKTAAMTGDLQKQAAAEHRANLAEASRTELAARVDQLTNLLQEEQGTRREAVAEVSTVRTALAKTTADLAAAERRATEAEARTAKADQNVEQARRDAESARLARQATQERLEAASRDLDQLRQDRAAAEERARKASEEAAELRGRLTALSSSLPTSPTVTKTAKPKTAAKAPRFC